MKVGSLCTGIAGLDMAAHAVYGAELAWCAEYEDAPASVLERVYPGVPNLRDLTSIDWHDVEPVDVLTAGYPCQPFSTAGRRQGANDERHLWPYIAEAVRVLRPRRVVLENVAGHLSLGFGDVLRDLAEAGFDAEWCVLRASDVGAPHRRARLFVVAADTRCSGRDWRTSSDEPRMGGGDRLPPVGGEGERQPAGSPRPAADTRSAGTGRDSRAVPETPGSPRRAGVDVHATVDARAGSTADAANVGHERPGDTRGRGTGPADRRGAAPHAEGVSGTHGPIGDHRVVIGPVSSAGDRARSGDHAQGSGGPRPASVVDWGRYGPAIRRWEHVLGRAAPAPTDDRGRLNPPFVEWMMGYPAGWTACLSRTQALKALGNAVVPQQGAAAIGLLEAALTRADQHASYVQGVSR